MVYDCLSPVTAGGGELLYRRVAELLVDRGIRTDYVTRTFDDRVEADFDVVGVWRGEIYDGRGIRTARSAVSFASGVFRHFVRRRRDYDVVVASALPVLTVLAARIALLGSGTRVVADWLEVWPAAKWREYSGVVAGTLAESLQWLAAHLVREHSADSRFTAERLERLRPGSHPTVLGLFDLVAPGSPRQADDPPFVLFVGRLIPDKAAAAVPDAIALARRTIPTLRARIVGDGPERDRVTAAVMTAGMSDHIDILGRVSNEDLESLRAGAAALVAPSIREGFGLAVAEASAWGVPAVVVAHEDNAAVELVESGINGFVVAPGDAGSLAAGIVEAVRGGSALRRSSAEWFAVARLERGLSASLDQILHGPHS